jgi:hypothetical protein
VGTATIADIYHRHKADLSTIGSMDGEKGHSNDELPVRWNLDEFMNAILPLPQSEL